MRLFNSSRDTWYAAASAGPEVVVLVEKHLLGAPLLVDVVGQSEPLACGRFVYVCRRRCCSLMCCRHLPALTRALTKMLSISLLVVLELLFVFRCALLEGIRGLLSFGCGVSQVQGSNMDIERVGRVLEMLVREQSRPARNMDMRRSTWCCRGG